MRVLGISSLDTDATASLHVDGGWHVAAEERFSRKKLHAGFPKLATRHVLESAGLAPEEIDCVAYPFRPWWRETAHIAGGYLRDAPRNVFEPWGSAARHMGSYAKWCAMAIRNHRKFDRELLRELAALGIRGGPRRVEHHLAHAAGAYLTSGFEEALAVTLDWYGSGLAGSVSACTPSGIRRLKAFRYPHSMGLMYAQVTRALGFTATRHEGKIVGLAAFGSSAVAGEEVRRCFTVRNGGLRYRRGMDEAFARALARRHSREDVAAAYQHALEAVVCKVAGHWIKETGLHNIVFSGGVAANVKLSQAIAALHPDVRIFIHPAMGDGGTGVGATLSLLLDAGLAASCEWETCFLGPSYDDRQMEAALIEAGLRPERPKRWAEAVASLLADGKVVARFGGPMEYGPRALGNRSILCAATDPSVNDWLNQRLGRTEFMPFAPATLGGRHTSRYKDVERVELPARFMTITVECTDLMKREAPAAVHVDGTARPQIVWAEENAGLHAILEAYHRRTGIPTLINTSFNMHEEPIVCTPQDALRAFERGDLDALSMGPFLVERPGPGRRARANP